MTSDSSDTLLELVRCDLCGADDPEPVYRLRDRMFETTKQSFQLVRCRHCGLLYLNPRPPVSQLGRYYRDDYAPFARRGISARLKSRAFAREVAALWPLLQPPARVIDVGCATGELLQAVRTHGNPDVIGIELSAHAAEIARRRWGLDVRIGTLEDAALPAGSVDVALMAHTAEHLPSPSATFQELNRVIKPGGALVLWVPNAASLAARLLGEWWIGYDAPRHLYTFSPAILHSLLNKQGFTVRSMSHEWIGLEWAWALRLRVRGRWPGSPLNPLLGALHPALTAACTPISALAALTNRAGRVRVVATRRDA